MIPQSQAIELVARVLGRGPWAGRPFGAGKFSETFDVSGPAGRYVLRVAPPDDMLQLFYERRMMRQEPAIHARLLAETTVPAPPILAHDFTRRLIDRDWLIMPRLEGNPFSDTPLAGQPRWRALREWGGYIRQIHGLTEPANRFGYLGDHRPMEPQPTWAVAFRLMYRRELDDVAATGIYDAATADGAQRLLDDNLAAFEHCRTSRLLHGDIWVTNLLVAPDGQVTGVLDFDRACWGDIEWDLAIAEYCGVTHRVFWEGYFAPGPTQAGLSREELITRSAGPAAMRRMFYLLYEHQKYIVISMSSRRGHNRAMAQSYADQAISTMERFRRTGQAAF